MMYFFHVEDGICASDPKGQEFSDDTSAMLEAERVAEGLSGHLDDQFHESCHIAGDSSVFSGSYICGGGFEETD